MPDPNDQAPEVGLDPDFPNQPQEPEALLDAGEPAPEGEAPLAQPPEAQLQEREARLQAREQAAVAQQQQAAVGIQRWLGTLTPEQRTQAEGLITDQLREAESKRLVLWRIGAEAELQGEDLTEFYDLASGMNDPLKVEALAARFKRDQRRAAQPAATGPRPGMATARPDAGAPNGNRAGGSRLSKEEVLKPFGPGGPRQGKLVEMEEALIRNGFG